MSQYLSFFLKKKNLEISVSMGYFCTTPARQISNLGAFPYTETDVLLAPDSVKSYLSDIIKERDTFRTYLENNIKKRDEIKQNLHKCASKEVAQMFMEEIESLEDSIKDLEEEVKDWNWIIDRISFIFDVWEDNQKEWGLYYSNC